MRISVIGEAMTKRDVDDCKIDKYRDEDPTVEAIGLRWKLRVLQAKESPATP